MLGNIVDQNTNPLAVDNWAIVIGTTTVHVIAANLNYIQSISPTFDYAVDITIGGQSSAQAGYVYNSGSDTFAPPVPPLPVAIQTNLTQFMAAMQVWVQAQYPPQNQIQFLATYLAAQQAGLTNRQAYIGQLLTWLNSIETYAAGYVATVKSLTDPVVVQNTLWDFTQVQVPNPLISLVVAIGINN